MPQNSNIRTLVIEDNPADARLIKEMLSRTTGVTFDIDSVETLAEGIHNLSTGSYEVLILDLGLPDSQGLETFTSIESRFPQMPVVILTGINDDALAAELVRKHAQDYLVKGQVNTQQLVRSLLYATERKRANEVASRLATIVRTSEEAIISKNLDGKITSWNRGARRLFGYSDEEALGKSIAIIIPEDRADEMQNILEMCKKGKLIESFETQRINREGKRIDVSMTITPITDSAGGITGSSCVFHDITQRKIIENKMKTVADTLQSALLPETPRKPEIDFGVVYLSSDPSGAKVGGDFYDFVELDAATMAVAIGDVSGKGLKTATTMAMVKYMLRAHLEAGISPGECLSRLNRSIYQEISSETFITIFLIILDMNNGTATYSSAGHTRPIVCRRGAQPEALIAQISLPLGLSPRYIFGSQQMLMTDLAALVLYTDGLIELRSSRGDLFGESGIIEALNRFITDSAQELAEQILKSAIRFANGRAGDDIAILTLKPVPEASWRSEGF